MHCLRPFRQDSAVVDGDGAMISMAPQGTQQLAVPIGYHTPTTRTAGAEDVQSPCLIHLRDQAEEWLGKLHALPLWVHATVRRGLAPSTNAGGD